MNTETVWNDEVEMIDPELIAAIEADIAKTRALLSRLGDKEEEDLLF